MSYFLWHNIGDMSGSWLGILDEEKCDLYKPRFGFNYQHRSNDTIVPDTPFLELWPCSAFASGDQTQGYYMLGGDQAAADCGWSAWEPWSASSGGSHKDYFVQGVVTDNSGNPLASAAVSMFLTATDAFVARGQTDQNGNFSLPSPFGGQSHYIVANYASGTYVGASVNTLTPNA